MVILGLFSNGSFEKRLRVIQRVPEKMRLETKWSSECKPKSSMVVPGLFSNGSFEKRYEL